MNNMKKIFDIRNFKNEKEICKIVLELGKYKLNKNSHSYEIYGEIPILEAAKKSAENFSKKAKVKPAISILQVILAANRNYNKQVAPKLEKIEKENPDFKSLNQLKHIIEKMTKNEFFIFWGHKDNKKYNTLKILLDKIDQLRKKYPNIKDDYELLNFWANQLKLDNYKFDIIGSIPNFGIATIQHLRMNFGIDTVKPDQRVKEVLEYEFKVDKINDINSIKAVEQIAAITGYKVIEIDQIFVKFGSGYYNNEKKTLNVKMIAKKLKELNISIDIISQATLLSKRQIELL